MGGVGVGCLWSVFFVESGVLLVGVVGFGVGFEKGVLGVVVGLGGDMVIEKVVSVWLFIL